MEGGEGHTTGPPVRRGLRSLLRFVQERGGGVHGRVGKALQGACWVPGVVMCK